MFRYIEQPFNVIIEKFTVPTKNLLNAEIRYMEFRDRKTRLSI